MSKRNTETLYLRVDPEVARLVRRASDERQQPLSQLAEQAFRRFLAEATTEEDRKNLLTNVEEALVRRLESRLGDALNRVANLYAKEAFDHAEGLFLIKAVASMLAKDERVVERLLVNARRDATERLKRRAGPEAEAISTLRTREEQLVAELKQVKKEAETQRHRGEEALGQLADALERVQDLQQQLEQARRKHEYERTRDAWAAQQYESQGMLRRRSFSEWQAEYTRQHPQVG